jgi:DNA-binding beta-propeller fold protein YncE
LFGSPGTPLWVSSLRGPRLYIIDPAKSAVAARVGTGSVGLACSRVFWVANYDTGQVLKIDLARRRVLRRVTVGVQPREVELGAGAVWVSNQGSGTVSRIRP